jgi:hypothetical protein
MAPKDHRKPPAGRVPRPRPAPKAPPQRGVSEVPASEPSTHAPTPHLARPPKEFGVGKVPNPRLPKLVRDVRGGSLKDLFELLPDLPRPPRPPVRKQPGSTGSILGARKKPRF